MKKKEVWIAAILSSLVIILAVYSNAKKMIEQQYSVRNIYSGSKHNQSYAGTSNAESQQDIRLISETIEGDLHKGTFEFVISRLEILTDGKDGYVKSMYMTYRDDIWNGIMICKVPPANVTTFTFSARGIIETNGTVTYIEISIESINASQQNQENMYSTISIYLKEVKAENGGNEIFTSIASALPILATGLVWITQGLIIGLPLYFAFLGIVMLVKIGVIPLWKNTLKRPKRACKT